LDESRLVAEAAQGDQRAFAALAERYRAYIYTIAYRITLNPEDALDVTQNVFVRVVEKLGAFNGRGPFRAWLATIAAREASDHLCRPSRREITTEPERLAQMAETPPSNSNDGNPRDAVDRAQRRRLVEQAMAGLSPQQRAVFALRWHEEMGASEIAERLGLSAGQVRVQLHRAIARIRDALAGEHD
jgi:RNA polymerase sigma-70 factor (ECF subfamily)